MQPHTLVLLDRNGQSHTYIIAPHNPLEGMAIVQQLAGLGLEPLARTLEGALPQLLPLLGKNKGAPSAEQLEAVIGNLKLGEAMASLSSGFAKLPSALIRQILAHTTRDGKLMGGSAEINLDFDAAYRANYGELLRAVWEVIGVNGFLPVSGISQLVAPALAAGRRALGAPSSGQPAPA